MKYLIGDLFCGAGGSSTGAERAVRGMGGQMDLVCVNHWPVAVETHRRNHPTARHYIEDVTKAHPRQMAPEGHLDLLMASPTCTYHSRARGGKPTNDQQRMPPFSILAWLDKLDVRCVLIENVPEFVSWGPVDEAGKPDKAAKGEFFQVWLQAFWHLGYKTEWRLLNAADYGDATTRNRFFLIARKDGRPIRWPEPTHAKTTSSMFPGRSKWRAAREIIDWQNPGRSLLDDERYQKRPLSEKTRRRIARGFERFGGPLASLYIDLLGLPSFSRHHEDDGACGVQEAFTFANRHGNVAKGMDEPVGPAMTAYGGGLAVVAPTVHPFLLGKQSNPAIRTAEQPIPSVTTQAAPLLITPLARPFVLGQQSCSAPRTLQEPIPTVAGAGAIALVAPVLAQYNGRSGAISVDSPVPTIPTRDRFGLANPTIIPFRGERPGQDPRAHSIEEPVPTITAERGHALAQPCIIPFYGDHEGRPETRTHSVEELLRTISTENRFGVASPVLIDVNHGASTSDDARARDAEAPLGAITSKRGAGLAIPCVVQTRNNGQSHGINVRLVSEPVYTVTADGGQAVVIPTMRSHQQGKGFRSVDEPLFKITAQDKGLALASPVIQQVSGEVDPRRLIAINGELFVLDIRFRMLTNRELARAMGFEDHETTYEFVGSQADVTRQIGNAVPVNLAKASVAEILS